MTQIQVWLFAVLILTVCLIIKLYLKINRLSKEIKTCVLDQEILTDLVKNQLRINLAQQNFNKETIQSFKKVSKKISTPHISLN